MIFRNEYLGEPALDWNERSIAEAMEYLDSKIDIGLLRRVDLRRDGAGPLSMLMIGLTEKMWKRVVEPEIRKLLPVGKVEVLSDYRLSQLCGHKVLKGESMMVFLLFGKGTK